MLAGATIRFSFLFCAKNPEECKSKTQLMCEDAGGIWISRLTTADCVFPPAR